MAAIMGLALFLALPQLAGWIATRVTHRSSALAWPTTAIATFSALWYVLAWLPAQRAAEHTRCGMGEQGALFALAAGLVVHIVVGVVLGVVTRRRLRP